MILNILADVSTALKPAARSLRRRSIIWMHTKIMNGSTKYGYIFVVQQEGIRKGFQTRCDASFSVIFIQSGKVHSRNRSHFDLAYPASYTCACCFVPVTLDYKVRKKIVTFIVALSLGSHNILLNLLCLICRR